MKERTIRRAYPRDNDLNCFGDYNCLELKQSVNEEKDEIREEYFLVGLSPVKGEIRRSLNKDEFRQCLRNLFFYVSVTFSFIELISHVFPPESLLNRG